MDQQIREYLQAYLDGEAGPEAERAVRAYLARDPTARRELEALQQTSLLLKGWKDVEPSPGFRERLAARIRSETGAAEPEAEKPAPQATPPARPRRVPRPAPVSPPETDRGKRLRFPALRRHWPALARAAGATAAVLTLMAVLGRMFWSPGQAQNPTLTLKAVAHLAGQATSAAELTDMDVTVQTAMVAVFGTEEPNVKAHCLGETAQTVTGHVRVFQDQRLDLRDLLLGLDACGDQRTAASRHAGRLFAAEVVPALDQRATFRHIVQIERQGRYGAALAQYDQLVATNSTERARQIVRRASCLLRLGRSPEAAQALEELKQVRGIPTGYQGLAVHLTQVLSQVQKAAGRSAALTRDALQEDAVPEVYNRLAHAQIFARQYQPAAGNLKRYAALARDPADSVVAMVKAAWCLRSVGQFGEAHQLLATALGRTSAEPTWLDVWVRFEQACTFLSQGQHRQALAIFDVLHQVGPAERRIARPVRAASLFLAGYLRLYRSPGGAVDRAAWTDAADHFVPLLNIFPDTTYAGIARGYLEGDGRDLKQSLPPRVESDAASGSRPAALPAK